MKRLESQIRYASDFKRLDALASEDILELYSRQHFDDERRRDAFKNMQIQKGRGFFFNEAEVHSNEDKANFLRRR